MHFDARIVKRAEVIMRFEEVKVKGKILRKSKVGFFEGG